VKKNVWLSAPGLICCAGKNKNELYDSCLKGFQGGMVMTETRGGKFPVGLISGELPVVNFPPSVLEPPAYAGGTKIIRVIDAGLALEQIGYINLHGTGTELNDQAEGCAMKAVFNEMPPISSTKPITGHTLGAAGALEAAICWMVLAEQKGLPVHCWDGVKDEEIPVFPAAADGQKTPSICMSNSFAFGGCNVSLILGGR